jgi:membrane associated rhomboid family serine protease
MSLPPPPPPTAVRTEGPGGASVCYRHPKRETGRKCTRCGKTACSECLVQASVGSHCVDCAKAARPDVKTRARFWSARQPAMITLGIIGLNVLLFLYSAVRDPRALSGDLTITHFQLGLFDGGLKGGARGPLPDGSLYETDGGQWYRLVTSGFMHYGIIHIALNMYLLYQLGHMIEPMIGRVRFGLVYLAALLGGSAGALMLSGGGVTAGASGAVFGLMGLAAVGYYLRGINPLSTSIGSLLMMNLFITFMFRGTISVGGHIGGLVAGGLCAFVVVAPAHRRLPKWATYATPVGVSILSVVVAVMSVG